MQCFRDQHVEQNLQNPSSFSLRNLVYLQSGEIFSHTFVVKLEIFCPSLPSLPPIDDAVAMVPPTAAHKHDAVILEQIKQEEKLQQLSGASFSLGLSASSTSFTAL
ncbi:hypothetical protein ILYODFUR_035111 [Ilyodon furcidens]|uniref:Uncharacterized protein n=1 Tax=Ilyodon furcidens TaxID=33524 RepID=A0ABV0U0Z2_9TELE